jgi:predicted nucleic acid-binding protein
MRGDIIVLDASAVIKWFSEEDDSDKAIELRKRFVEGEILLVVPDLLIYEITNALRYNKRLGIEDVKDAVESIFDLEIDIVVPTKDVVFNAIEIALDCDITTYDATYVALAEDLGAVLITSDKKLARACKKKFVKVLKDF